MNSIERLHLRNYKNMYLYRSNVYAFHRLKSFIVKISPALDRNKYLMYIGLERSAKRLHGYLSMIFGEKDGYYWLCSFEKDQVDDILSTLKQIDDGIGYIYNKEA